MVYRTTKDEENVFVAQVEDTYIPFPMPTLSIKEISALGSVSFSETIAAILNKFYSLGLTGWDIDCTIGRKALKLEAMSHRMVIAELWHNLEASYDFIASELHKKFCGSVTDVPADWFKLSTHIAVLFGLYCELFNTAIIKLGDKVDISMTADDFSVPLAAIYARQMGLPIGTIIVTTENDSGLWDLVHLGELSASVANQNPEGYELLVHALLGADAADELRSAIQSNKAFLVDPELIDTFNQGLFCVVTGSDRSAQNINSTYRTNSYIFDPMTALSVGGLQDYRAKSGESRLSLVLSCISPLNCIPEISHATGISQDKLIALLKNPPDRRQ